ncbi:MAG: PTS ascorbate transporter subunit IIC [Alphaproteobacteria bacterium]|jgi:PTS system ascorbate-specific IIC component|nr:PTS ascorbate transporter subunit IIC [Alphaproteobacteria bacterium]
MLSLLVDILSIPALLVGLIVFLGLILQKKPSQDIILGTFKSILGFVVLGGGATILVASLNPFGVMFQEAFNLQGIVPNNEAIVALSLKEYGSSTALIMFFGMIANILIARFTPFKFIFLTGHHTFYMAAMISVILISMGLSGIILIIAGSLTLGIAMVFFPAISYTTMQKITNNQNIGMAHFGTLGYVLSAFIGKIFGKSSPSTESLNLPKNLGFLRDSSVMIALTMGVLYIVVAISAGQTFVETNLSGGQNYIVFAIMQGITFSAGIYIILAGVRLLLGEIVPAFKGISEKVVKDAKPALDCPVIFTYSPNAVIIGFLCGFIGGVVGLFVLGYLSWALILPGVVPHFFTGATAGVFGNATGGRRGAMLGSFANGILITFLPVALLPVLGDFGFANTTFSDSDFALVGIILGAINSIIN